MSQLELRPGLADVPVADNLLRTALAPESVTSFVAKVTPAG